MPSIALATTPFLPPGLPVALALAGLVGPGPRQKGTGVMTIAAILLLAGGTFAFRLTGPLLHRPHPARAARHAAAGRGGSVLLVALVVTSALTPGHGFAGWARPAGVLVGGGLAVLKVPFPVVVVAAAATAAGLRLAGVR